jgi:Rieske 2Fe-2S family protein
MLPLWRWHDTWAALHADYRPGHGLPGGFYGDPDVYAAELDRVWRAGWLFAGHTCEVTEPGDYFTFPVGPDPVLVLRNDDGSIGAFDNVCTHRGTVLCQKPHGRVGGRIVCPYHQWTFSRGGDLVACRGMHDGVDRSALGLRRRHVETVAGMIFVSLAETPADFRPAREVFAAAGPHGFDRAKVAQAIDYVIDANWKVVWENNRECYHCDVNHPQYIKANFDNAAGDQDTTRRRQALAAAVARAETHWAAAGVQLKHASGNLALFPDPVNNVWYSASRTVQTDGFESESMDGRRVAPYLGDVTSPDVGVLRMRCLPNFWNHTSCDHAVSTRLLPLGQRQTQARVIWLVDREAREGADYQLEKLLPFWQLTSEQDWGLCAAVQRGVESSGYRPGPLSRVWEYNVDAFIRWYLRQMAPQS